MINKFEVKSNSSPFEQQLNQDFLFSLLDQISPDVTLKFVSREDFETINNIPSTNSESDQNISKTVFIPTDLKIWEIVGIIEKINPQENIIRNNSNLRSAEKIRDLGETFKSSGIYLAKRVEKIKPEHGQEIASALAIEFYEYGKKLLGEAFEEEELSIENIRDIDIDNEEIENVDRFLAGNSLYESRLSKMNENEDKEEVRIKTLNQFFKIAKRSFEKISLKELLATFKGTPTHWAFLERVQSAINSKIEGPITELERNIFSRGMAYVRENLLAPKNETILNYIQFWINHEKTFREKINIESLKRQLDLVKSTGNNDKISKKELEIVSKIQREISKYPYDRGSFNPKDIIANTEINCLGATLLASSILEEVGINYLPCGVPRHSVITIITSNNTVQIRDMLSKELSLELTDDILIGKNKQGEPMSINDIILYNNNPNNKSLLIKINLTEYNKMFPFLNEKPEYSTIEILNHSDGLNGKIYNSLGVLHLNEGNLELAREFYYRGLQLSPENINLHLNMVNILMAQGYISDVYPFIKRTLEIDPEYDIVQELSGRYFYKINNYKLAEKHLELALKYGLTDKPDIYKYLADCKRVLYSKDEAVKIYLLGIQNTDDPYLYDI